MLKTNSLYFGDCLEVMKGIDDKSIDLILTDPPYATTGLKWDSLLDSCLLWAQYERIIKDNAAIILFGQEPFSSKLRLSNLKLWKYDYIWVKSRVGNFLNAKNSPMKKYENVMVFSKGMIANGSANMMKYFPQGLKEINRQCDNTKKSRKGTTVEERPSRQGNYVQKFCGYPNNILEFKSEMKPIHPTQKPLNLLQHLIKTYTEEGELVLDSCCGVGSTCVAAINTNRQWIGIENNKEYFDKADFRIKDNVPKWV